MDKEQLLKMDSFMLLSIINMKLRDEFDSLNSLCEDYEMLGSELENKLSVIGYKYNENTNQFTLIK
ncbi:hypothetical protein HMPREF1982_02298 [Clostridiales bacterium oral taxon 876 str. F0540]|nr:hypothetical protein HMPREF1982_02298 [Clostridiales bacterium oral taxon 876 str. F0540]